MYVHTTASFCILMCKTLCGLFLQRIAEISPSDKALDTSVCLTTSILHTVFARFQLALYVVWGQPDSVQTVSDQMDKDPFENHDPYDIPTCPSPGSLPALKIIE